MSEANAIPGGSKRPSPQLGNDGKTVRQENSGVSIFDPVLCELAYRWFSKEGSIVLDPFAGGSVRGIVASKLGRKYYGIELREEQVLANRSQAESICEKPMPIWFQGNSTKLDEIVTDKEFDLIFSCPPYADLEVYSDLKEDLSTMAYEEFLAAYKVIIAKAVEKLKQHRFACFVVGEVREKKGDRYYRNFVGDTVEAFEEAGARFYNEGILITPLGSLPLTAGRTFKATRKFGKTHQNVLVFCKGSAKIASEYCGEIEIDESLFSQAVGAGEELQDLLPVPGFVEGVQEHSVDN